MDFMCWYSDTIIVGFFFYSLWWWIVNTLILLLWYVPDWEVKLKRFNPMISNWWIKQADTHTHTSLYQHDDELNAAVDHYNLIKIHSLKNMLTTSTVRCTLLLYQHINLFVLFYFIYSFFLLLLKYQFLYAFLYWYTFSVMWKWIEKENPRSKRWNAAHMHAHALIMIKWKHW